LAPIQVAPRRRVMRALIAVLVVVVLGGGALALVPSVGPFGFYFALDHLKAREYRRLLADKMAGARARLSEDTFPAARGALEDVERARARAKRVKGLAAYAALLGYLRELRFGSEPEIHARSGVLLDELNDAHGVDQLPIAQAARSAANGEFANARQRLDALLARDPRNVDVLALRGELELRAHDPKAAVAAWKAAGAVESSARTTFGLARAFDAAGDNEAAQKQAQATLDQNKALAMTPTDDGEVAAAIPRVPREERSDVHRAKRRPTNAIVPISGMLIISRCVRPNPQLRFSDAITELAGVVPALYATSFAEHVYRFATEKLSIVP